MICKNNVFVHTEGRIKRVSDAPRHQLSQNMSNQGAASQKGKAFWCDAAVISWVSAGNWVLEWAKVSVLGRDKQGKWICA